MKSGIKLAISISIFQIFFAFNLFAQAKASKEPLPNDKLVLGDLKDFGKLTPEINDEFQTMILSDGELSLVPGKLSADVTSLNESFLKDEFVSLFKKLVNESGDYGFDKKLIKYKTGSFSEKDIDKLAKIIAKEVNAFDTEFASEAIKNDIKPSLNTILSELGHDKDTNNTIALSISARFKDLEFFQDEEDDEEIEDFDFIYQGWRQFTLTVFINKTTNEFMTFYTVQGFM